MLPPGLSLNGNSGVLSGTTVVTGTFTFTVRAIDRAGDFGSRTYTISVSPITPAVTYIVTGTKQGEPRR